MVELTKESISEALREEEIAAKRQILNYGMDFFIRRTSFFGKKKDQFGRPARTLTLYKPYLYTMDEVATLKIHLQMIVESIKEDDPVVRHTKIIKQTNELMAEIIAVSLLNRKWKIKLFRRPLTAYLRGRIHSEKLHDICTLIYLMEDARNFMKSTVLMSGDRTTRPKADKLDKKPIEKKPEA